MWCLGCGWCCVCCVSVKAGREVRGVVVFPVSVGEAVRDTRLVLRKVALRTPGVSSGVGTTASSIRDLTDLGDSP